MNWVFGTVLLEEIDRSFSMDGGEDQSKQSTRRTPFTELNQVSSDFILAMAMQEQEQAYTMLETIESDSSDEEEDDASSPNENYDQDDTAFFESREFETEFGFLANEDSGSSSDQEMDEDDFDVDELTYEELIALGEFIGEEKRGLPSNEISTCLQPYTSKSPSSIQSKTSIDRCVICQIEYEDGEALVALSCQHPYHWDCISKWLEIKKSCPICSTEVSSTSSSKTKNI
ncbi:hypothetical protein PRUPE_1G493000 [Prunus persica]|uniref:RING-type domain-containing protein n=1 Tax=Prunus persica TaxID=3760 RepID=A0A251RFB9_PRUPE|nr:E3 ubiquitin ligase BIG BROTHER-related [Prunus persica]ONI34656.1 hypothetical protein PRUPE_1G493000 [Prunus persica]